MCVQWKPTLRMEGEMFSLRQREVVAGLASWDPCLTAGIGKEPAAPLRARCCFIYPSAQVTFLEERHSETYLWGLSASPLISFVTHLSQKGQGPESSGKRFSISFNWSVNIHPIASDVWLHSGAEIVFVVVFLTSETRFRHLNVSSKSRPKLLTREMLVNFTKHHLHTQIVHCSELLYCQGAVCAFFELSNNQ